MTRPHRDESGSALVEFTWLAILLLVPLVWIVISVFQVQQGAFAVSAAARAAGRARVVAGQDLERFTGGAAPVTDATAKAAPRPPEDLFRRR